MAKVLLVEDDNNLREIYEARLQAEGYTIVSAQDGEEALVVAKREKPDLIISDVMMPRISGFEMLDILRNTEGLKDVKIIMLTALSQAEDKTRADKLGADRYLVKSQVTLEDIVKSASDLLENATPANGEVPAVAAGGAAAVPPSPAPQAPVTSKPEPVAAVPMSVAQPPAMPTTANPAVMPVAAAPAPAQTQATTSAPAPVTPAPAMPVQTAPVQPVTPHPSEPVAPAPQADSPGPVPAPVQTPSAAAKPEPPVSDSESIMKNAVKDLLAGAPELAAPAVQPQPSAAAPAPAQTQATTPAPAPVTPAPAMPVQTAPVQPVTPHPSEPVAPAPQADSPGPVPAPVQTPSAADSLDDEDTVRKKIIQPINPNVQPAQNDLTALLAKEGITDFDRETPGSNGFGDIGGTNQAEPHPPGHVFSPNQTTPQGQPFDPNSISL